MQGSLLQLMTLVTHGNAFLLSGEAEEDFYPSHSTFQGCAEVLFNYSTKSPNNSITRIDVNPNEWFKYLIKTNCRQLYLKHTSSQNHQLPEHIEVAFSNGGARWYLVADFDDHASYWNEYWKLNENRSANNDVWNVIYSEVATQQKFQSQTETLETEHSQLTAVLEKINDLAIRNGHYNFAECFQDGIEALCSNNPKSSFLTQGLALDNGYSLRAKQIIVAACHSGVFGGMGSWNDIPIKETDSQEYSTLSRELYSLINFCIEKGINSYARK